jgi:plastocyanin
MKPIAMLIVSFALSAFVLTACGGSQQYSSSYAPASNGAQSSMSDMAPMPAPGSTVVKSAASDIVISGFAYTVPGSLSPGQQVTVVNKDSVEHTVTADANNAFDVEVAGGASATFTVPDTPGTYAFHCTYHPKMHGSLTVQ